MFSPTQVVIDAFVEELHSGYLSVFPNEHTEYADTLAMASRVALESLANTDSPYHDINHSLLVTSVGQQILRGRFIAEGDVTPREWLHFIIACVHHDSGYVRGICRGDRGGHYVINSAGETIVPPPGSTDAYMTPYHVERGQVFIRERYRDHPLIDTEAVCEMIERTRFPIPEDAASQNTADWPGLARAADLIGQLADPHYMQKLSKLYMEFRETGEAERLGYENAAQLRSAYPGFFWGVAKPYLTEGIGYLRKTQDGLQWIANLYAHVFSEEHEEPAYGPERRTGNDRRSAPRSPLTTQEDSAMTSTGRRKDDQAMHSGSGTTVNPHTIAAA